MLKKIQIFLFVSLFVSACTINEPKLPSWETEWNIYLPTEDFIMVDAINDTSLVADTTESGIPIVSLSFSDSTDREYIGAEDLALEPQAEHHKATLDEIKLNKPKSITTDSISVMAVLPDTLVEYLNAHNDSLPPYPQATISSSANDIPNGQAEFTHYEVVEVITGNIYITFHNNMFLKIRPGMQIEIYDSLSSDFIGTAFFEDSIPPYSSGESDIIDLAGKTISNKLLLEYSIPIAGSDTFKVLTEQDKNGSFYNEITMSELKVAYAIAKIPMQEFTSKDSIDLTEEDHRVKRATIDKGQVFVYIKNNLPIKAETKITLQDFRKDDQPKVITVPLESEEETTINVDLSGWELINYDNPGEFIDYVDFYSASSIDSTEGFIELAGDDSVSIDVTSDSLFFSYVEGYLDTIDVDIDPVEISNFDFFEDIEGKAALEDLVMTLNFENQINFPINVDLKIGGYHYDKILNQITDSVIIFINDLVIDPQATTELIFDADATSPSIVELIAIFPTEIKISGSAFIKGEGSASLDDGLQVFYNIESPLSIDITEAISFEAEVERLDDLDKDMREILSEDMTKCCVIFDLRNTLPIAANIKYYIAADSLEIYSDEIPDSLISKKIVINESIAAGNVGASGYVDTEEKSTIEINLSEEQLDIFKNDTLYTRQVIEIPVTNGTVRIRQADGIKIEGNVNFKVFINKD
jgi:RNase P/RNase MRP subunit p29